MALTDAPGLYNVDGPSAFILNDIKLWLEIGQEAQSLQSQIGDAFIQP